MVMLLTVIRPSIESASTAGPAYSMTWPVPPAVPSFPMIARIRSFAVHPNGRSPLTVMRIAFAGAWMRVWVASTCSTSDVPMPNARAPNAPWVAVWLSPHTMVVPGRVKPCSGPMMWTIPLRGSSKWNSETPNSSQLRIRVSIWSCESSPIPSLRSVAMLWSMTAMVASVRRTLRPACRNPS